MAPEVRQRVPTKSDDGPDMPAPNLTSAMRIAADEKWAVHPSGKKKKSRLIQLFRSVSFGIYFFSSCIAIHLTQWIGAPLYWYNREWFYAYMAMSKQSFGLLITSMTYWWSPTTIRISGDASVAGQIKKTADGRVQFSFPPRLVLIANHQIYTDWLYLWWVGYANEPQTHGYLYIILKESLKYFPLIGPGMMFYGFIFMSRKMAVDQPRMAYRLQKLKTQHTGSDGIRYLDPMWLLLFPEGTNLSDNGRAKSANWAEKIGVKDFEHVLLPRSTGMYFCLNELKGSVEYVYDCTVAYEGVPRGKYGEDYFTLVSSYFQGQPPKSVNFHWRRFRVDEIPLDDQEKFEKWLHDRWAEKDMLMEAYLSTGRFPSSPMATERGQDTYIETEVRTRYPFEWLQIFAIVGVFAIVCQTVLKVWRKLFGAGP